MYLRAFFFVFSTFSLSVAAAQTITLSGKVTNKDTGEALEFASISLKGKPIGMISNAQGEFDFHLLSEFKNEIVVVSMLGFRNFEASAGSLNEVGFIYIQLEPSTMLLPVVIVKDSLRGGDILKIALSRIDENFPNEPFILDVFYRDVRKIAGTYISLLEAAVQIYDEDYREPRNKDKLREQVKLLEIRQSLNYESKFTSFFDRDNLLKDLLLNNNIRYRLIPDQEEVFEVTKREKDSFYNGHSIFVVSFQVNYEGEYFVRLFINKEDFSIIRIENNATGFNKVIEKKRGLISRFIGTEKIIEFKNFGGKMYLNFIKMTSKINWYDAQTNDLKFESELFQQLLVNKVNPEPTERIASTESMKKYGLQYQNYKYDKKFWDSYNVIKRTPLDKQIIADLEKAGPLEKQFQDN
jgi:hypothetical protein